MFCINGKIIGLKRFNRTSIVPKCMPNVYNNYMIGKLFAYHIFKMKIIKYSLVYLY